MLDKMMKKILCILIGHSRIHDAFFGYIYCGRCGEHVGDILLGDNTVLVGHYCEKCFANYKEMTWRDKLFVPYPFTSDHPLTVGELKSRRDEAFEAALQSLADARLKAKESEE